MVRDRFGVELSKGSVVAVARDHADAILTGEVLEVQELMTPGRDPVKRIVILVPVIIAMPLEATVNPLLISIEKVEQKSSLVEG